MVETRAHPATMAAQISSTTISADSPIPVPFVTTNRLIVRELHPSDVHAMTLHGNNSLVAKYMSLSFPHPYNLSDAEWWINMNAALPHQINFAICERSSPDVYIGGIGLQPGRDVHAHTAEIGYWVGEKYWGKGYMTEVLEGFTKWCFESWEKDGQRLRRLAGRIAGGNVASIRCFEKCGYSKEGVLKGYFEKHGEVRDMHIYGLTKADWERRTSEVFNNQ